MSFALINPTGWTVGDLLTEDQINQLDADHVKAIDGTGGGTYNLTAPLTLAGDTVTISEALVAPTILGNTEFSGVVTFANNVDFDDTTTFAENATFSEDVRCFGEVETQQLQVNSSSTFGGAASFQGDTILGNASHAVTIAGALEFSATGRVLSKAIRLTGADTVDITTGPQEISQTSATTVTTTLTDTFAQDGDWFTFFNRSGVNQNIDGIVTGLIVPNFGVKYVRIGGVYVLINTWT